ncbi:MAG: patatin-like phospholipase family protein, partial [Bacteroidia bacterium]
VWQSFDLIAGTSTGGLIACALTIPKDPGNKNQGSKYSVDDVLSVYQNRGKEIFPPRKALPGKVAESIDDTMNPRFTDKGISKVFNDICGNARINDSLTHIMVSTYDLNNNCPLFFKTRSSLSNHEQNILIYDICRATSAGPTYLPAYELHYPNGNENPQRLCIDGGVYINNPSLGALTEFLKNRRGYGFNENEIDQKDIHVLSIGTGIYSGQVTAKQAKHKGEIFWASHISDIMMRGVNKTTHYQMQELMPEGNYLRMTIDIHDKQYSEMSRADEEAYRYLIEQTNKQVLNNGEKMREMDYFLARAGLLSTLTM